MLDPADAPDPDLVYANYLKTCAMLGIEPVPRERAEMDRRARSSDPSGTAADALSATISTATCGGSPRVGIVPVVTYYAVIRRPKRTLCCAGW